MMRNGESERQQYELLRSQLEMERSSFLPHFKAIADVMLPRRLRYTVSDVNRGDRRNTRILDGTATKAIRTLRSGMMAGVTSPARPWFRLTTPDSDLAEFAPVKRWLHATTTRMSGIFLKSNLYNALPIMYGDIGTFGTSAVLIEEDEEEYLRAYVFPVGTYSFGVNARGRADTFSRRFQMTVRQVVKKFGNLNDAGRIDWTNISQTVKDRWESGQTESWVSVVHIIKPNERFDPGKIDSQFKRFVSVYYEEGSNDGFGDRDKFLRKRGYSYFPVLIPRWETSGEDSWATDCPGMTALGDTQALQLMQKRKAQAVELLVRPPMKGPTSLKTQRASILPGEVTYDDSKDGGFRPIFETNPRVQELLLDIQDTRQQIKSYFFEDLFLMLASSNRRDFTAREIDERHEEKLLALGPVLEQFNQDVGNPLIDITFGIMLERGEVEAPPEEIADMDLRVVYESIMAQAQKMIGLAGVERFTGFVGGLIQADPRIANKINRNQLVDIYAEMTSVPPSIVRSDDEVEEMEAAQAEAQAASERREAMLTTVSAAKELSQTKLDGNTALAALAGGAT